MGAHNSTLMTHGRIDSIIPRFGFELLSGTKKGINITERLTPLFPAGEHDRGQFIHSLRILLGANGQLPLANKRFRLVFSRAPEAFIVAGEDQEQIYASVVAIGPDGIIAAKVTGERAGTDNIEAFHLFRKTVEMRMHEMLESIPEPQVAAAAAAAAAAATSSSTMPGPFVQNNHSNTTLASTILPDEPPSYQEANN